MGNFFKKIKDFIFEHCWIIILSLLLTIMIFAPLIIFPVVAKKEYRGININHFGTDTLLYLTRGREVLDGHGLGNPLLREGKDYRDTYLSYSDYILLAPIKLLGLASKVNIVALYNSYNFIGVFLLIILIYFFVLKLSGKKILSITAALFAIGGYSIVYFKTLFYHDFNVYARVIYPWFSSLIMFSYFNLLVTSLKKSAELKYKILAGLAFGLLFYVYFYAWTFTLAFNACLFFIFLFRKNYSAAKIISLISGIGLALGAYNLVSLFASLNSEIGKQMSYFILASYSRAPIFSKIGFLTLILFAIFYYKKRDDQNLPIILAFILSGWVALNQQVVTGRMLQYGHYYFYFIVPLSIIISLYMIWRLIEKKNLRRYLFAALIAVVFINTAGGQYKSFFYTFENKKYEQSFRPIIDALNREAAPSVILANQENEYLFTIYTPHDLFWHGAATLSYVPLPRLKDALFIYFYFNKNSRNNFSGAISQIMADNNYNSYDKVAYEIVEGFLSGYNYYEYQRRVVRGDQELLAKREKLLAELQNEYNNLTKDKKNINKLLKNYGVNFVVWDKNKHPEWDLSFINNLQEVTSFNNIYLYRIAK